MVVFPTDLQSRGGFKMRRKVCAIALVLVFASSVLFAAEPSPWKKEGASRCSMMKHKFAYGLSNVLFGWTEIFQEPYEAVKSKENVLVGIGKGLGYGVADTLGGVVHLVTFWCNKTDLPLPEGGIQFSCCKA